MSNYVHDRRIARQRTAGALSGALLECFPDLAAIQDEPEPAYRDRRLTGPVMATWKEATILNLIVRALKPQRAVEIGTSVGWTAAHIRAGMPEDGYLACIDPFTENARGNTDHNGEVAKYLYQNLVRCGYEEKWDLYMQESPAILDRVRDNMGTFDFVFIDGWHQDGQPERDVEGVLPFMSKDGVIVLHDFDLPDVQNAGMLLAQHAYHYHGFHTRHKLAIFLPNTWPEKGPQKFPRWWKKLLADVSKVMEQD